MTIDIDMRHGCARAGCLRCSRVGCYAPASWRGWVNVSDDGTLAMVANLCDTHKDETVAEGNDKELMMVAPR